MKLYYNKIKKELPNITEDEFDKMLSFMEREGFVSYKPRNDHEIYDFFIKMRERHPDCVKCAEIETREVFDISIRSIQKVVHDFRKNYLD